MVATERIPVLVLMEKPAGKLVVVRSIAAVSVVVKKRSAPLLAKIWYDAGEPAAFVWASSLVIRAVPPFRSDVRKVSA